MTAHLAHLAARERQMMTSTVTISRAGPGDPVFNPDTGGYDNPPPVEVYTGRALIRPIIRSAEDVHFGGQSVALSIYNVTLPLEAIPEPGDVLDVLTSPDPLLSDLTLIVDEVFADALPVNRRLLAEASG
ncbi:hypothetical protein BH23ACT9_BH23ACT9_08700 [soil metagenome]